MLSNFNSFSHFFWSSGSTSTTINVEPVVVLTLHFTNPLLDINIEKFLGDQDGRIVLIDAYLKKFKFTLCNIYAPNNAALQKVFIKNPSEILISKADISSLIIGDDWNVTLEAIDKKGGIQWKPTIYQGLVVKFMKKLNLVDILRIKNPGKWCFTTGGPDVEYD